jgi:hypothetical protein
MEGFKHSYRKAGPARHPVDHARDRHAHLDIDSANAPGLRYSSPWPWALALAISLSIWAGLALLVRLSI